MSTRCSETYETKTALLSLFGVPLWYFSQSPRVAIQVSRRPGCHMRVPALSSRVLLFGGVCVPLPQRCRLEHASPESTVQGVPRAAAPDPGAESRTSRSPPSPLAQRRFLKPLLALLVSGPGAGEAARAIPCWASPSQGCPLWLRPRPVWEGTAWLAPGEPGLSAGRQEGPCRGPGASGTGRAAGALGEAEMNTGMDWGGGLGLWMARPRRGLWAPPRQYKLSLRRVLRLYRLGLSPHTGRERGLSIQPEGSCVHGLLCDTRGCVLLLWAWHVGCASPAHTAGFVWWGLLSVC